MDFLNHAWQLLASPAGGLTLAAVAALAWALAGFAIKNNPELAADAKIVADVTALIEPWVAQLEKVNMPGAAKADQVLRKALAKFDEMGIHGDARAALEQDLPKLIDAAVVAVRAAAAAKTPPAPPTK